MSKFDNPMVPSAKASPPKSSGRCDACGWDFSERHTEQIVKADGTRKDRTVHRDQINIPIKRNGELVRIVTRCGDCYERETFNSRRSRWSGVDEVEMTHRQSFGSLPDATP